MYERICQECGGRFLSPRGYTKYCENCREDVYRRGRKRLIITVLHDTEEMRNKCLSCTQTTCKGTCTELARVARGEA